MLAHYFIFSECSGQTAKELEELEMTSVNKASFLPEHERIFSLITS